MQCDLCNSNVHLKCLPQVDKTDTIFTQRDAYVWYCSKCTEHIFPFNHIYDDDEYIQTLYENIEKPRKNIFTIGLK